MAVVGVAEEGAEVAVVEAAAVVVEAAGAVEAEAAGLAEEVAEAAEVEAERRSSPSAPRQRVDEPAAFQAVTTTRNCDPVSRLARW